MALPTKKGDSDRLRSAHKVSMDRILLNKATIFKLKVMFSRMCRAANCVHVSNNFGLENKSEELSQNDLYLSKKHVIRVLVFTVTSSFEGNQDINT